MGGIVEVDASFKGSTVAVSQLWSLDWPLLGRGGSPRVLLNLQLRIVDGGEGDVRLMHSMPRLMKVG